MSLDLTKTAAQLEGLTAELRAASTARAHALAKALGRLATAEPARVEERRREGKATWLVAGLSAGALGGGTPPVPLPVDHVVVSVDGSHIDVDRHSPARCYLINTGHVMLRYGELPDARLWSTPALNASPDDLVLRDESGLREQPIEGPLLGMVRTVAEVEALADAVAEAPAGLPMLALLDGSLIMWGLSGQAYPEHVRTKLLDDGLLPALDRLRDMTKDRTLAVASYVSLPRSADVVNALRLDACPYPTVNCDQHCRGVAAGQRPCDEVAGMTDGDLFSVALEPGERSAVFSTTSTIVEASYREHQVRFFYLNVGDEVARVELPAWCADDERALGFAHAALLSQTAKGHGYPVALQEAHEQAVVSGADREHFALLVEAAMAQEHLPTRTSQKARSKRTRFV